MLYISMIITFFLIIMTVSIFLQKSKPKNIEEQDKELSEFITHCLDVRKLSLSQTIEEVRKHVQETENKEKLKQLKQERKLKINKLFNK